MSTDNGPSHEPTTPDADLRDRARRRIEQKRGFWLHLAIYLAFNGMLVVVWAWTGAAVLLAAVPDGALGDRGGRQRMGGLRRADGQ